jgi:hypothetical protein
MTKETKGIDAEQFLAIRREAGLKIDPATAEIDSFRTEMFDPYGIYGPSEDAGCIQHEFARSPGSDIWVWFCDLPEATLAAIQERIERLQEQFGDLKVPLSLVDGRDVPF